MSLGTPERPLRVAVVGSGPAGFFAAQALLASELEVTVDILERLPTPFGLVRGGVAPDHPKIKRVEKGFARIAARPEVRFFGGVTVGRDVTLDELRTHYDQICLATGTEGARALGIPGEDLPGCVAAPNFVGWFNAHPEHTHHAFDLSARTAVVIGVGNVAIDVARILVRDPSELARTDIAQTALDQLRSSRIEDVYIIGRRGPAQVKYSPSELRDLAALSGVDVCVGADADLDAASEQWLEGHGTPKARRNLTLLEELRRRPGTGAKRRVHLWLRRSPVEVIGRDHVQGIRLERNRLIWRGDSVHVAGTGASEFLEAGLVVHAVGYQPLPLPGVPFDRGFTHRQGRIVDGETVVPGLYVAGWAKRGPTGVIGTNRKDAVATVHRMLEDVPQTRPAPRPDPQAAAQTLGARARVVRWSDWMRIDARERELGAAQGRPRQKLETIAALYDALYQS